MKVQYRDASSERVPNMMDCLLADVREHSHRMTAAFEAIMQEGREALEDTGFRRREFRDRSEKPSSLGGGMPII